ncbi:MAG: hypothetical protein HY711_02270 [Candidatus Melainabacteria bacterium]|nr:hypothetical protein [Candidatus Melainabacteria bacterium]
MKSSWFTYAKQLLVGSFGITLAIALFINLPAYAQGGDAFSAGAPGMQSNQTPITGSQTQTVSAGQAPMLQGATNGTIGPQAGDATVVQGVNTAGTVRVNNLANLEALLNIIANGMEILGIAWGGPTMIMGFMHMAAGTHDAMKRVLFGAAGVTGGLATPGCINWLVASARDANLFS